VGHITGLEGALHAAANAGTEAPERVLGVLSPESLAATIGPVFALDKGGRAVKDGDTLTVSRERELVDPYTAVWTTVYSVNAGDGALELAGPVTVALRASSEPDATPALSITEQSGSASAEWDAKTSRLRSFATDQRLAWKATLELSEPMTTARATTAHVELKAVE
jgi:hypothetical protein